MRTTDNAEKTKARKEATSKALESFRVYSLSELEPILGVTHRTLLRYISEGKLKAVKMGGRWKVSQDNLRAFVNG